MGIVGKLFERGDNDKNLNLQDAVVTTLDNKLLCYGSLKSLDDGGLKIISKHESNLPDIVYNTKVKIKTIIDNKETIVSGNVKSSSASILCIEDIETLTSKENRVSDRYTIDMSATLKYTNGNTTIYTDCDVIDISLGGVLLDVKKNTFNIDNTASIIVVKHLNNSIEIPCKIVRVNSIVAGANSYGARFDTTDPALQEKIQQFVSEIKQNIKQ